MRNLTHAADDAEAIAQLLEKYGGFRVRRLPETTQDGVRRVFPDPPSDKLVTVEKLEEAIAQLFNPEGRHIPDTALLFFAGHGLRKKIGHLQKGYLATSEARPKKGLWGFSLNLLRELLEASPIKQQIIWLDCCHSGELLNFEEANPGEQGQARDRCFIAAARDYESAYEQLAGNHGVLTAALLQGLDPQQQGKVNNHRLVEFINQQLKNELQQPLFLNTGSEIILTPNAPIPKLLIQPKRQLIDSEKLPDIKFILANVEGSWTNEDLKNICLSCIPDHSSLPNCRDETNLLPCLLEWLAKMPISSSGRVPILEFVARLIGLVPTTHQKMLQTWIDEVGKSLGITQNYRDELLKKQAVVETAPTSLPQYLLIELAPKNKHGKYYTYTVQAWLFTGSEPIRNIYTKDKAMTLEAMPELIDEILEVVCDFKVSPQLMIEFILPRDLLYHNIEHCLAESDEPIGIHYPVVVRSRERMRKRRLQQDWCQYWEKAKKKGVLQQMAKTCEVRAETQMDQTQLRKLTGEPEKGKICFVFSSVPKMVMDSKKDLFFTLIRWGMPIALLPRHINSDNEFKQVLSILRSCSLEHLPQRVFEIRRKLWQNNKEQHTGYHLSLLWDDPDRIPPEFPRLHGPN
jgi:hypothetical protein